MKETPKLPAFTANHRRIAISLGFVLFLIACQWGCIIKIRHDKDIQVPEAMLNAKTAGLDELLGLIANYGKINELVSKSLKLTLERKISDKKLESWKRVSGYIYLKRPDSVRIILKSPLGPEFDMASVGDGLSAWIPSKNRFYLGKNSAKELVSENFTIPMRGPHIFDAVLPQNIKIDSPEIRISLEEAMDTEAKYYIISFYKDTGSRRIHAFRKIWIERSKLAIERQQFYFDDGQVESDIKYSMEKKGDLSLPLKIHIDRPLDGYSLTMEFGSEGWRINSGLEDKAFVLPTPPGAEIIHLSEKTKNGAP
jgi:outer membrane lipoprotein-sorting protein